MRALTHPDWVRRMNLFGETTGDPARMVGLDADEMLDLARATTGLGDLGADDWPGWDEAYRRLLASIDAESQLHLVGRVMTRGEVLRMLQTRLRLQAVWNAEPAIKQEPVEAPLFVVGPPRTGTTILLELLALDPSLRAPLAWEALHPLPVATDANEDRDRRTELSECEQEFWSDVHPEFMTMTLASHLPCECVHFLAYDFSSPHWSMLFDTPTFTGWQLEHVESELERVYRLHRRMLQTFQHGSEPRRWLLKSPGHLQTLAQLFAEYPDAKVIHTHRDPRRFIASLTSLLAVLRFTRSDRVDVASLGPLMELTYQLFLEQVIDQRESGAVPNERIVDSHFLDLMSDPVASLRRLYDELELPWPARHDEIVRDYLAAKPKDKHGAHRYEFVDVGLDEGSVRSTFARYVAHYGITEEP